MADHKNCKYYDVCDYRNDIGSCPDRCVQYKHKDYVLVVRCKDCKAYDKHVGYCEAMGFTCEADDFCSYGERRTDG